MMSQISFVKQIAFIAAGGAVGAVLRFLLSSLPSRYLDSTFPYGTLLVNLLGAFLIGVLWQSAEKAVLPEELRPLLITGLLGALTTFSTFALENMRLIEDGKVEMALIYLFVSNSLGILLAWLGAALIR